MITQMFKKENIIKVLVMVAIFIFIILLIEIGINFHEKKATQSNGADSAATSSTANKSFENSVLVQTDDGTINKVDIASGKVVDASALENEDFSGFSGLPLRNDEQKQNTDQSLHVSGDKSKAIV